MDDRLTPADAIVGDIGFRAYLSTIRVSFSLLKRAVRARDIALLEQEWKIANIK